MPLTLGVARFAQVARNSFGARLCRSFSYAPTEMSDNEVVFDLSETSVTGVSGISVDITYETIHMLAHGQYYG
jgi:hypothetical protein